MCSVIPFRVNANLWASSGNICLLNHFTCSLLLCSSQSGHYSFTLVHLLQSVLKAISLHSGAKNFNASHSVTVASILNYSLSTYNLLNNEYIVLIRISMSCFADKCFQALPILRYLWRTQCCSNKCVSCISSLVCVIMVKFSKCLWKVFAVLCFCCSQYVLFFFCLSFCMWFMLSSNSSAVL